MSWKPVVEKMRSGKKRDYPVDGIEWYLQTVKSTLNGFISTELLKYTP